MPVSGWTSGRLSKASEETRWEGRLEILQRAPMLLVDGAHNPAGAATLRRALQEGFPRRRLILIFGVLGDKDYRAMARRLFPLADRVILTRPHSERALPLDVLLPVARRFHRTSKCSQIRAMPCGPPSRWPGRRISSASPVPSISWEKSRRFIRTGGSDVIPGERAR